MDFRLALLLLTLGSLFVDGEGRKCGIRNLRRCQNELAVLNQLHGSLDDDADYPCEEIENTKTCFVNFAEECYDTPEEVEAFLAANIQELRDEYIPVCDVIKCLAPVEEDAAQCVESVVEDVIVIFSRPGFNITTIDQDKLKCMVFRMIVNCIQAKVHDRCGDEVANAFKESFEREAREIIEACRNGGSVDIELLEENGK